MANATATWWRVSQLLLLVQRLAARWSLCDEWCVVLARLTLLLSLSTQRPRPSSLHVASHLASPAPPPELNRSGHSAQLALRTRQVCHIKGDGPQPSELVSSSSTDAKGKASDKASHPPKTPFTSLCLPSVLPSPTSPSHPLLYHRGLDSRTPSTTRITTRHHRAPSACRSSGEGERQ